MVYAEWDTSWEKQDPPLERRRLKIFDAERTVPDVEAAGRESVWTKNTHR